MANINLLLLISPRLSFTLNLFSLSYNNVKNLLNKGSKMNIEKFKKLLLKKRETTQVFLESVESSSQPVDLNDPIGRLSRMDAIQQQQMSLVSKKRAVITLKQIEAALKRIEEDNYGVCLKCDEDILEKRLLARPEGPFCTDCQE